MIHLNACRIIAIITVAAIKAALISYAVAEDPVAASSVSDKASNEAWKQEQEHAHTQRDTIIARQKAMEAARESRNAQLQTYHAPSTPADSSAATPLSLEPSPSVLSTDTAKPNASPIVAHSAPVTPGIAPAAVSPSAPTTTSPAQAARPVTAVEATKPEAEKTGTATSTAESLLHYIDNAIDKAVFDTPPSAEMKPVYDKIDASLGASTKEERQGQTTELTQSVDAQIQSYDKKTS